MTFGGCIALALLAALPPSPAARGHEVRARLLPAGMELAAVEGVRFIPTHLELPEMPFALASCSDTRPITWYQRHTVVDLHVDALELSVPSSGTLRVEVEVSGTGTGVAFVENGYACLGSMTCTESLEVSRVRVMADMAPHVDAAGRLHIEVVSSQVIYDEYGVSLALGDCAVDDLGTWAIGLAEGYLLDAIASWLQGIFTEKVAPLVAETISDFTRFHGSVDFALLSARQTELVIEASGIEARAEADFWTPNPPAACVGYDPGDPTPAPGQRPELDQDHDAHVALSVSLGLVEDLLYHVWRHGLTCLTDEHLRAAGLDVDLAPVLAVLPGFPAGTTFGLEIAFDAPPWVTGDPGPGAALEVGADSVSVVLTGTLPGGGTKALRLSVGLEAVASLRLEPLLNALVLRIEEVRFVVNGIDDAGIGFDVDRLSTVLGEELLPPLLAGLGDVPLFGPVVAFTEYYTVPRRLATTATHVLVSTSIFRAPEGDVTPPVTYVTAAPVDRPVRPSDARIEVAGQDDLVPAELLRFAATVDGVERAPSYLRNLRLGSSGSTRVHEVSVRAVDLAGNADPTPVTMHVVVDGVAPLVHVTSDLLERVVPGTVELSWWARDDLTPAARLATRIDLYRLTDATNVLSVELLESRALAAGATRAAVEVQAGEVYRAVVVVADEAGNQAVTTAEWAVAEAAGCTQSRPTGLLAAAAGLLLVRRRRAGRS